MYISFNKLTLKKPRESKWAMSSYFNPKISYERPNWKNLAGKIHFMRQMYKGQLPEQFLEPMLEECFSRRDIVPTKDQLYAVATQLEDTSLIGVFQQKLQDKANKKILGLSNVYSEFMQSNQWQQLQSKLFVLMNQGDKAVNKLIDLLKNSNADYSAKAAELAKVLHAHVASEAQLNEILKAVKGSHLTVVFADVLQNMPNKINTETVKDFLETPQVKNAIQFAFNNPKEKGRAAKVMYDEVLRNSNFGDYFQDESFYKYFENGKRYAKVSKYDNPLKLIWGWGENTRGFGRDLSHLSPKSFLAFLKGIVKP